MYLTVIITNIYKILTTGQELPREYYINQLVSFQNHPTRSVDVICILEWMRLRLREAQWHACGYTTCRWQGRIWKRSIWPKPWLLIPHHPLPASVSGMWGLMLWIWNGAEVARFCRISEKGPTWFPWPAILSFFLHSRWVNSKRKHPFLLPVLKIRAQLKLGSTADSTAWCFYSDCFSESNSWKCHYRNA